MKVYVVFHADLEDDRDVRAVCSTAEKAKAIADSVEPCSEDHQHWMFAPIERERGAGAAGSVTGLFGSIGRMGEARARVETDALHCISSRDHYTGGGTRESLCCGVDEWEVDGITPAVVIDGIFTGDPLGPIPSSGALVPTTAEEAIHRLFGVEFPAPLRPKRPE